MRKYKTGDKIVLEILPNCVEEVYKIGSEIDGWNLNSNIVDEIAKPLSEYTEKARTEGQNEAWELIKKIGDMYCRDLDNIFDSSKPWEIVEKYSYVEADAKVAEWEQKNKEICVGDVLLSNETGNKCIVTRISNEMVTTLWNDGSCGDRPKDFVRGRFKKIGHIDVDAWLAQIGGE